MTLVARRYPTPRAFLDAVGPVLRRSPVTNQLPLAIAQTCATDPGRYGEGVVYFDVVDGAGAVLGAALMTPPWAAQLSQCTPAAARALAAAFATELAPPLPGVGGPDDAPTVFAEAYAAARGLTFAIETALGTFELTAVADVPTAPGHQTVATAVHADLLQRWLVAFRDEASHGDPPPAPDAGARVAASGRAHLWLDAAGQPVSYAFHNRDVEGWSSIGPVYTPPELRGRGYATALVADLSRALLATGRTGCTLYTDLANPTSNKIYERIGYRRVGSALRYTFAPT